MPWPPMHGEYRITQPAPSTPVRAYQAGLQIAATRLGWADSKVRGHEGMFPYFLIRNPSGFITQSPLCQTEVIERCFALYRR